MADSVVNATVNWIEVAYACSNSQTLIRMKYQDMTAEQAIERSGILDEYPEIDLAINKIGLFGNRIRLSQRARPGDRIEIYRPLMMDPRQARRMRAVSGS